MWFTQFDQYYCEVNFIPKRVDLCESLNLISLKFIEYSYFMSKIIQKLLKWVVEKSQNKHKTSELVYSFGATTFEVKLMNFMFILDRVQQELKNY